jgi:hypothetical protein
MRQRAPKEPPVPTVSAGQKGPTADNSDHPATRAHSAERDNLTRYLPFRRASSLPLYLLSSKRHPAQRHESLYETSIGDDTSYTDLTYPGHAEGPAASRDAAGPLRCPGGQQTDQNTNYLMILVTWPAPTVRPPSRMANFRPSSMAIGWISATVMAVLSPGMTISVPSGRVTTPVTSVVRK